MLIYSLIILIILLSVLFTPTVLYNCIRFKQFTKKKKDQQINVPNKSWLSLDIKIDVEKNQN